MTYFGFLVLFLLLPIMAFFAVVIFDRRKGTGRSFSGELRPVGYSFLLLVIIALIYTTPWDNYLVATQVWWYDASKVFGVTLGWVPLEEYLFFILQPVLVGLWMLILISRISLDFQSEEHGRSIRGVLTFSAISVWILSIMLLVFGGMSTTYLGLEVAWALLAFILQLAFGGDILWRYRRLIFWSVVPLTFYFSLADAFAIQSGIWTISPTHSTGVLLGGVLPIEEFVFFLLTNSLVAFGFVLIWSPESFARSKGVWSKIRSRSQEATLQQEL